MVDHEPRGSADGPTGTGSRRSHPDVTSVPMPWVAVIGGIVLLVLFAVLATVAESRSVLLG